MVASEPSLPPRFRVVRQLGAGAMGIVLEVVDEERDARVALKTLRHADPDAIVRFKNEFRTLADIGHENLVALGELLEHEGAWFFTMELVDGVDLLSWVRPGSNVMTVGRGSDEPTRAAETLPAASNPRGSVHGDVRARLGTLDPARVRDAFAQLVRALDALHSMGKVHRDVKPSNVLVTREGRVVLLDFGIAGDARKQARAAGTVAYMAPEQADAHAPTPAADFYALGAVLYEALTGTLPFEGSSFEVLEAKRRAAPTAPSSIAPEAPDDLSDLALRLLANDPAARPTAREIISVLVGDQAARKSPSSIAPPSDGSTFVGRRRELAELVRAWARVEQGHAVTVYVHGESGVGKSALVRELARQVTSRAAGDRPPLVLWGRCFERESVPFKAVDGVIDALHDVFGSMPDSELRSVLPADAGLLARVFPILDADVKRARRETEDLPADQTEQRARVFTAFRELVSALTEKRPVVLVLEDLQWADADSFLLLRELLRAPDPPPILLLATVRTSEPVLDRAGPPASLPQSRLNVGSGSMPGDVRVLALGRLALEDAEDYANVLVGSERARAIAEEAGGHPLLIEELAGGADAGTAASLSALARARRDALAPATRELLELVVLARAPVPESVLRHAADIKDGAAFDRAAAELRQAHLARRVNSRGRTALEPYHGRVREALRTEDDATSDARRHRALALGFEADAVDPGAIDREAIAEHWRGAGESRKAADQAIAAAREAAARLAFDRAARLHQWALDLVGDAATEEELAELADAQKNAARGAEAADAYLAAAARASGARALDLRRRAAHELFACGHVDAGRAALAPALEALGIDAEPPGPLRSLVSRATSYLRGTTFRPRPASEVSDETRARADVSHTLALGLALVDVRRATAVSQLALPHALASGDRIRAARALALDSILGSLRGDEPTRLALAQRLTAEANDSSANALTLAAESARLFAADDFAAARERAREARREARDRARGATSQDLRWEITAATWLSLRALSVLGDVPRARVEASRFLESAEARGDRLARGLAESGWIEVTRLAQGDVDVVQASRDEHARGPLSPRGRLDELVARVVLDLYLGEGTAAYRRSTESLRALAEDGALASPLDRAQVLALHARGAVAHARKLPQRARELLDEAQSTANDVAAIGTRYALVEASLLRGAVARARGETTRAVASFQSANTGSAALGLRLHGAVAALAAGRLRGGDEGRGQVERALASLRRLGVADPDALAGVFGA